MGELPFGLGLVRFLADHRVAFLTALFQFFSFLGDVGGYVLVMCVALILGTLLALDAAFEAISDDYSLWGQSLRYLRYASAAVAGMLLGPLVSLKLGSAARAPNRQAEASWKSSRSSQVSSAT